MRTDWSQREDPAAFLNASETGPHVPGPSVACMRFLVEQRDIRGWGVEAVGTDAGQAFAFEPPFPAHNLLHGAGKFGLASLCQLDQLPPTGARPDHAAAQDRERLGQPAAGAGAGRRIAKIPGHAGEMGRVAGLEHEVPPPTVLDSVDGTFRRAN